MTPDITSDDDSGPRVTSAAVFAKPLQAMDELAKILSVQFGLYAQVKIADKKDSERYFERSATGPVRGWDDTVGTASGKGADRVYHSRLRVSFENAVTGRAGEDKIWNNYHLLSKTPSWEVLHKGDGWLYNDYDAHFMKRDAVLWVDVTTKADGKTTFKIEPERSDEMPGRFGINYPGRIFGVHTFWSYYGLKPNAKNGFDKKTYVSEDGTLPVDLVSGFKKFYEKGVARNIFKAPTVK